WQTNAALLLIGVALFFLTRQLISEYSHYTIGFSGVSGWSCLLYLCAAFLILTQPVYRFPFPAILAVAVACRLAALFAQPYRRRDDVWAGHASRPSGCSSRADASLCLVPSSDLGDCRFWAHRFRRNGLHRPYA